jgi:glucose-6-phosphate isomerase
VKEVAPFTIGVLIALFERAVGFYASLVNINAYHQPGVEAGKKAAGTVLSLQARLVAHLNANPGKSFTVGEVATAIGAGGAEETLFKIGSHLAANVGRGVQKSGSSSPAAARFAAT